jgi:hypothetical protein
VGKGGRKVGSWKEKGGRRRGGKAKEERRKIKERGEEIRYWKS